MLSSLLAIAILTAIALIPIYSKLKSRAKASVHASNGAGSLDVEEKIPVPGSSIADPDPLHDFDLETATARNFIYANKTLRYPYYQASDVFHITY